jgi:hypothetical protein
LGKTLARPDIVEITGKGALREPKGKRLAQQRRDRFERELCLYSIEMYHARKLGNQPPYMPELRALYMAVRETYKGSKNGIGKGQTVDHMWPRVVAAKK